jgi:3-phosphoshikimate 1-carboxyvinyltransferase
LSGTPSTLRVTGGTVAGRVAVPGDKSISHRAALIGALASGTTTITGFLHSADCRATLAALRALGVAIEADTDNVIRIQGRGGAPFQAPAKPLDLGNSGTSIRLLAGLLAGQGIPAVLTGDDSLRARPMGRVTEPLRAMGSRIDDKDWHAPLRLNGGALHGIRYRLPVASAQVKSALLLAGLHADGETWVESAPTRDHTERMLEDFGVRLLRDDAGIGVTRCDWSTIAGRPIRVPGDASSAAFFAVGAALVPGATVVLEGIGMNPGRTGFLEILRRMGATVVSGTETQSGGEPSADVTVTGGPLHGVSIAAPEIPGLIDEIPALLVAAACAEGETVLDGAGELRHKESDRLAAMAEGLRALGGMVDERPEGLQITGGPLKSGTVNARGDHRVAMAFVIAGTRADGPVRIQDCSTIDTSFPGFVACAQAAGIELEGL